MKRILKSAGTAGGSGKQIVRAYGFWLIVAAFLLAQVLIWFVLFQRFWFQDKSASSVHLYYFYAQRIAAGLVPYRDFSLEYPPVVVPVFYLPWLFSGPDFDRYFLWFEIETLVFSCSITVLMGLAARHFGLSLKQLAAVLLTYALAIVATGSLVQVRFDLLIAFLVILSLAFFLKGKKLLAWSFLGVGIMLKLVPVLLAPLYFIGDYRQGRKRFWLGPMAMALAALLIALPYALMAPAGLLRSFLNHLQRPVQLESTWALPFLWAKELLKIPVRTEFTYGSDNIVSMHTGVISLLSGLVLATVLALGYYAFYHSSREAGVNKAGGQAEIVRFAAISLLTFILFGKVFSPQYVIWLLPLIPLAMGGGRRMIVALFLVALLLTQYEYPYHYPQLVGMSEFMVGEVTLRDLLLWAMLVLMLLPGNLVPAQASASKERSADGHL